jgi:hypothetical protein
VGIGEGEQRHSGAGLGAAEAERMHEIGGLHKVGEGKRRRGIALWAARADARGVRAEPRAVKPRERSFLRTKFVLLFILFSSREKRKSGQVGVTQG